MIERELMAAGQLSLKVLGWIRVSHWYGDRWKLFEGGEEYTFYQAAELSAHDRGPRDVKEKARG